MQPIPLGSTDCARLCNGQGAGGARRTYPDDTPVIRVPSNPELAYHVNGACGCEDYSEAPGKRCAHRWAVALYRKALQLEAEMNDVLNKVPENWQWYATVESGGTCLNGIATVVDDSGLYWFQPWDKNGIQQYEGFWSGPLETTLSSNVGMCNTWRETIDAAGELAALICKHDGTSGRRSDQTRLSLCEQASPSRRQTGTPRP